MSALKLLRGSSEVSPSGRKQQKKPLISLLTVADYLGVNRKKCQLPFALSIYYNINQIGRISFCLLHFFKFLFYFQVSIQQNYRNNPFHNFRHCFCVTQMVRVKKNCNALVLTSFRVFLSNNHYMYEHQEYEYEYAIQFYLTACKIGAAATTQQSLLSCKISWGKNFYH